MLFSQEYTTVKQLLCAITISWKLIHCNMQMGIVFRQHLSCGELQTTYILLIVLHFKTILFLPDMKWQKVMSFLCCVLVTIFSVGILSIFSHHPNHYARDIVTQSIALSLNISSEAVSPDDVLHYDESVTLVNGNSNCVFVITTFW